MCSPDEALAFLIELGLTQRQYQALRNKLNAKNALCIPAYRAVLAAKQACVPPGLVVHEGKGIVEIGIQPVLDHQMDRLLLDMSLKESIRSYKGNTDAKISFWNKYGPDSSTAHSQYMTKDALDHQSIFSTTLTPVCIQATSKSGAFKPLNLWLNESANSPFACSYLRIAMEKETEGNSLFHLYPFILSLTFVYLYSQSGSIYHHIFTYPVFPLFRLLNVSILF